MKLIDALERWRRPAPESAPEVSVFLACSFTPLHLIPFLGAELRRLRPEAKIAVQTGLFGDLPGNIGRIASGTCDFAVVLLEWRDLDPRLAIRDLGGWKPGILADITSSASKAAGRLEAAIRQASAAVPMVVCMPTLSLPPLFPTRPEHAGPFELQLSHTVAALAASLSECRGLRILNSQLLNEVSPQRDRYDPKSDVTNGFPYSLMHASQLGELLAPLLVGRSPKKGIITDLDDTLWAGIAGEDGVEALSWTLDHGHHHGLYQQFLSSLAGAGILVGIASKNDPAVVQRAFDRSDLLISREEIYPFETRWSRKSESVDRILQTWNIAADAVVFVDDSPIEVAEVQSAFPEMECVVFPKNDYYQVWSLLKHLREQFGKPMLTEEDTFRLQSLRTAGVWQGDLAAAGRSPDEFLQTCEATIVFERLQADDRRALELLNKTNQFNLNGRRTLEAAWQKTIQDEKCIAFAVSYQDKYGALGKIAVIVGRICGASFQVESWVMSCRAFSRRIEHQCLRYLFDYLGVHEMQFDYKRTERNTPMQEFLAATLGSSPDCGTITLSKSDFEVRSPALFHQVEAKACV